MYSIGCIRKNGSLLKLASIIEDNDNPSLENFINFQNENLNNVNNKIVNFIMSNSNMEALEEELIFKSENYIFTFNHIFSSRKYKLYFFTQVYNNTKKYICYYSDKIIHQGFGNTIPSKDEILKLMILYYIENHSLLMNQDMEDYDRKVHIIESNFGF